MTGTEILSMAMGGLSVLDAEQPEQARLIGDVIKRRMKQLDEIEKERALGHKTLSGFPTGVAILDEKLGGWQPGIVSLIAARPGMGKSSLGLATADATSKSGAGVHIFSLEDTEQAYADRTMARSSGVSAESIRNCDLARGDVDKIQAAILEVAKRKNWLFDDRSGVSAQEIVRSVRRHKKQNGTRVVIVDYIQLVAKPSPRMTTHEALSETITTFADAAKQDGIAYVVMSQLNRKIEEREDKRPQLADLRESGSLEERSKCVVAVYRGAAYGKKPKKGIDYQVHEPSQEEFERQVQLLVIKNSNGRTGTIRATWHGPTTRIE
jgi:replicative DNA helicase